MADDTFHIRDKRAANRYFIDNDFLRGGWGHALKPHGIAVYNAIALHIDNETQTAYPSYKKIADLTGMSARQVPREIEKLVKYNIIHVESRADERKPAVITLLDKSEWIKPIKDKTGSHMTQSHKTGSQKSDDSESAEHMTGSHANNTHDNTQGTIPNDGASAPPPILSPEKVSLCPTARQLKGMWHIKHINSTQAAAIQEMATTFSHDRVIEAAKWARMKGLAFGQALGAIQTALPTWGQKGNGHGNTRTTHNQSSTLSDEQQALLDGLTTPAA